MTNYVPSHYIQCDGQRQEKAEWILHHLDGTREITKEEYSTLPLDESIGLICVVQNGLFDAALHVITEQDREATLFPSDARLMKFISGPMDTISYISGYSAWKEDRDK